MSEVTRLRGEVEHLTEMLKDARMTKLSTLVEDLEVQVGYLSEENATFANFLEEGGYSESDVDLIAHGWFGSVERNAVATTRNDRHINIPITDWDVGEFRDIVYKNKSFQWSFDTEYGERIWVNFMSEDELEQRER